MDTPTANPAHTTIQGAAQLSEEKLELLTYWRTFVKHKLTIFSLALAVGILAAVVVYMMRPIYRATAMIQLEDNNAKVLSIEQVYSSLAHGSEHVQTQADILRSRTIAELVLTKLDLVHNPEFSPGRDLTWLAKAKIALGIAHPPTVSDQPGTVLGELRAHLTIAPVPRSNLIQVSYDSPDPRMAALIANTFAEQYIRNDMENKFRMTQEANSWLNEHLAGLKAKLEASEQRLQTYRNQQNIIDVNGSALSGTGNQLEGLVTNLVTARMKMAEAASAYQQIRNAQASGTSLDSLPLVVRDPVVAQLEQVVAQKQQKVSELSKRYGPKFITMIQAQAELQQARDNLKHQVAIVVSSIEHAYNEARANVQALSGAVAEVRGSIRQANEKQFALADLQRDVQTNQQVYDMFLQRFKETSAATDLTKPIASVVDPATAPVVPLRPHKARVIAAALLVGLLFGIAVAFLLERLDTTVRSTEEVGLRLGQPILTTLPLLKDHDHIGRRYLADPHSQFAEAVRTARTGVLLSAIDQPHKIVVVTSSLPGEGKTTFAANLALAHAQTKRVLLIDADMRKPRLGRELGLDDDLVGLSSLASGEREAKDCMRSVPESTLQVITAGAVPPNPLELLLSQRFQETIAALSREFDLVILDSPPVHLVSDAIILSTLATGVVFVMKANSTPYQVAQRCLRALQGAKATLFGVVLNQLDFKKAESHYGDYSGYGSYGKDAAGYYMKESS
ncbi:tyrosine-protein kinase YwqD [mine drainage metagenome]|uniref:non-specific protein-tyrosine kinase n=1 Tax=mine drainage metagenome TaxID=410659 RepID=A0A1J5R1Y0_9ZZZZ